MKQHREAIKTAIKAVFMKQGQRKAVGRLAQHLNGVELEAGLRNNTVKQLGEILSHASKNGGKLPVDEHARTIQILFGNTVKETKITLYQCANLAKLCDIINDAVAMDCKHGGLAVIALIHGGGFTPTMGLPELFCPDCTLNVTLWQSDPALILKNLGMSITAKLADTLHEWAKAMYHGRTARARVISAREMTADPAKVFKDSAKFEGDLSSIKITNKKLFESKSGV